MVRYGRGIPSSRAKRSRVEGSRGSYVKDFAAGSLDSTRDDGEKWCDAAAVLFFCHSERSRGISNLNRFK